MRRIRFVGCGGGRSSTSSYSSSLCSLCSLWLWLLMLMLIMFLLIVVAVVGFDVVSLAVMVVVIVVVVLIVVYYDVENIVTCDIGKKKKEKKIYNNSMDSVPGPFPTQSVPEIPGTIPPELRSPLNSTRMEF